MIREAPAWLAFAIATMIPGWLRGGPIPGSAHTDTWESLWGLWHALQVGPGGATTWLDWPRGGTLYLADPLHAVVLAPLTATVGPVAAWNVAVIGHVALAGAATAAWARARGADPMAARAAGVAFACAPGLLAAIHNGTSETVGWGLVPLAAWAAAAGSSRRATLAAIAACALAFLASPYLAVAAAIVIAVEALAARDPRRLVVLAVAGALVAPWYATVIAAARAPDNLIGIKDPHELALLRRTIGSADPLGFVIPGAFRSPDFTKISRYGEDFVHCTYLGAALIAANLGRARRPGAPFVWGAIGLVLACGPVLVHDGSAVLIDGRLGVPLPYFLIERLPGWSALSLLYRLSILPALALALGLAGLGRRRAAIAAGAVVLEVWLASPMAGGPSFSSPPAATALRALRDAPAGGVANWPVVGGRPYLYEATVHGHPVAGTLNFPVNEASRKTFDALRDRPDPATAAKALGVRYVVVHADPDAAPGPWDGAIATLRQAKPLAAGGGIEVYALW